VEARDPVEPRLRDRHERTDRTGPEQLLEPGAGRAGAGRLIVAKLQARRGQTVEAPQRHVGHQRQDGRVLVDEAPVEPFGRRTRADLVENLSEQKAFHLGECTVAPRIARPVRTGQRRSVP